MIGFELLHAEYCEHCKKLIIMLDEIADIYDIVYDKLEISTPEGEAKKIEHNLSSIPILLFNNKIIMRGAPNNEIDLLNIMIPYMNIKNSNDNTDSDESIKNLNESDI